MKTALPENAKIAKEAKECMQECVSEFISFITSEGLYMRPWKIMNDRNWIQQLTVDDYMYNSIRKVPGRETQDGQWRGHPLCYDFPWVRELCRGVEDLPVEIPRSKYTLAAHSPQFFSPASPPQPISIHLCTLSRNIRLNN